jgi:hypothetical protein
VQLRGNPAEPGAVVTAAVPAFLAPEEAISFPKDGSGRLQLADWLADDDNPLTPRVIANRIWQHHFGRGIVNTPSNFGTSGEAPTHPELLDWLAKRFIDSKWSIKKLHRLIMLSKTYRLASDFDPANAGLDPDNRLRWRFSRSRLDAEALRDALLFVSGQLDLRRPGAHPFPPIEKWNWTQHTPFRQVYPSMHRSVYLMTQRLQKHPYLALFDGPDTNTTTAKRPESTVPLQALFFMNSPFIEETSSAFAARLTAAASDNSERMVLAYRWAYGRLPTEQEHERGLRYISHYSQELRQAGAQNDAADSDSWKSYARVILTANEFLYID